MATLTATTISGTATNRVELDWSSAPAVLSARIHRLLPGESYDTTTRLGGTAIRLPEWGLTYTHSNGFTYTYLSAGVGVFYDDEAPLDVAVTYVAESPEVSAATVVTSSTVTIASNSQLWLKNPLKPSQDIALNLCPSGPSGCTQPTGVFFQSMGGLAYSADNQLSNVANRIHPDMVYRARKAPTGELRIVSRGLADRTRVLTLIASGDPLFLQAPAVYAIPDMYLAVGDAGEDRIMIDHRQPQRLWTLPWSEVDAPAGPAQGPAETKIDELCTNYATWTALIGAGWTWQDILQGDAV